MKSGWAKPFRPALHSPNYSSEIMIEIVGEDLRPVLIIPWMDATSTSDE